MKSMMKKGLLLLLAVVLVATLFTGCQTKDADADGSEVPTLTDGKLRFTFANGLEGWYGGFADLPLDYENVDYNVEFKHADIPVEGASDKGLFLGGMNRSDDLFMFIASKLTGFEANKEYTVKLSFDLATNVPGGMMGVGGSPDSVWVKAGFVHTKPEAIEGELDSTPAYIMNLDKGNQIEEGPDMRWLGDIAKQSDEEEETYEYKQFSETFTFTTNADGEIYLIIGTDSGFEGRTELYYTNITIIVE